MTVDCEAVVLDKFIDVREFEQWEYAHEFAVAWMVLLSIYFAVPMTLMWIRRALFPVNLRPVLLVQIVAIGVMQLAATTIGRDVITWEKFPCDALLWSRTLLVPMWFGPHLLIMLNLLLRVELAEAMQAFRIGEEELRLDELIAKVRATTWQRQLIPMVLVLLPALVLIAVGYREPYYGNGCTGCYRDQEQEIIIAVFALVTFVGALIVNRRLRRHEDPLGLRREVDMISYCALGAATAFFVWGSVDELDASSQRGEFNEIWWLLWAGAYAHFVYCIRPLYRSYQAQNKLVQQQQDVRRRTQLGAKQSGKKDGHKSKTAQLANSSSQEASGLKGTPDDAAATESDEMTLAMVLESPAGVTLFQHYLASEFSVESILFWKSAREWRRVFPEVLNQQSRDAVAMNIFLAFVPDGAPMQINLASANRAKLQASFGFSRSMSTFSAPTEQTVFDDAIAEVFTLMEADSFQRFRETRAFKALNEDAR